MGKFIEGAKEKLVPQSVYDRLEELEKDNKRLRQENEHLKEQIWGLESRYDDDLLFIQDIKTAMVATFPDTFAEPKRIVVRERKQIDGG